MDDIGDRIALAAVLLVTGILLLVVVLGSRSREAACTRDEGVWVASKMVCLTRADLQQIRGER